MTYVPPNGYTPYSETYGINFISPPGGLLQANSPPPFLQASVTIKQPNVIDEFINPLDDMLEFYKLGNSEYFTIFQLTHYDVNTRFWGRKEIRDMVRNWFYDDLLIQISPDQYFSTCEKRWNFYFVDKRDYDTFMTRFNKNKKYHFFAKKESKVEIETWLKENTKYFNIFDRNYNNIDIFIKNEIDAVAFKMKFANGVDIWD